MRKRSLVNLIFPAMALMSVSSCQDYDAFFSEEAMLKHEYAEQFEKTFGKVDPNHDWSMAQSVQALVNLPELKGESKMNIMTGDPRKSESRLLGQLILDNGVGTLMFDAIKGEKSVFVSIENNGKYKVFDFIDIIDGEITFGDVSKMHKAAPMTRAFSDGCSTTQETTMREVTEIQVQDIENTITYSGKAWKQSKWAEEVLADPGSYFGSGWKSAPFTDESFFTYIKVTGVDWSKAVINSDQNKVEYDNETEKYTLYFGGKSENPVWNSGAKTLDDWKKDVVDWHLSDFAAGSYNGIWTKESMIAAAITEPCDAGDAGATRTVNPNWQEWVHDTNMGTVSPAIIHPTLQYLDNVDKEAAPAWTADLGYSFFGPGSFFEEKKAYYGTEKLGKYYTEEEMFQMEQGFSITTKGGPIELPYIFGCTAYTNQFGYVYWKVEDESKPDFDPLKLKHFVLIEDARPSQNIYKENYGGTKIGNEELGTWDGKLSGQYLDGSELAQQQYQEVANKSYVGTTYRVMYFGDDYNNTTGSYDWDEGYRIMFFIVSLANYENASLIESRTGFIQKYFNYSIPAYNNRLLHTYQQATKYPDRKDMGLVKSIAWSRDGKTFLGFGDDSGDQDLNDIVFLVAGNFDTDIPPVKVAPIKWHLNYDGTHHTNDNDLYFQESKNVGGKYSKPNGTPVRDGYEFKGWAIHPNDTKDQVLSNAALTDVTVADENGMCYYAIWEPTLTPSPDPDPITWIFACEDLGGTFDYDFNDVVWEVKKGTGSNIQVRLLAAGGTLPFTLAYNGTKICTKEEAYGAGTNTSVIMNSATSWYTVDTGDNTWTLSGNTNKFTVAVEGSTGTTHIQAYSKETEPSNTPQVIVVPGQWRWPKEGINIKDAYGTFNNWVNDATWTQWTSSGYNASNTVNR